MADEVAISLVDENTRVRVSSVLNRDVNEYGKKFMFDGCEDTCWNSDQGSPQFIVLDFAREVSVKQIKIQFQGGFAGKDCQLEGGPSPSSTTPFHEFYPEDVNIVQMFPVSTEKRLKVLKIVFVNSTDFFGRITIYNLEVLGAFL